MQFSFLRRQAQPIEIKAEPVTPDPFDALVSVNVGDPLSVPVVKASVSTISEAAATLDIALVRRGVNGEAVKSHPALDLLRGQANPWTSGFELIRDLVAQALTNDVGGLAWVNRAGDVTPREIIRYDSGRISVLLDPSGSGEPTYKLNGETLDPANVVHVRGVFSKCPMTLAANAIATAAAMEAYAKNLFANGARPGGVIEFPKPLGDTSLQKMRASWQAAFGGASNSGKTAVLWDGAKFTPIALSSTDAQFLELRRFAVEEIARTFNIPVSMVGDLTRSSFSNAEQRQKEFLSYCLEPWLRSLESAFDRGLLNDDERRQYTFRFDRDDISRVDLATRAQAINSLIASQVLNPNEGRDWLTMPPRAGGAEYLNPNITVQSPKVPPNE